MDHFACAHGGIHRFGLGQPQALTPLSGTFILGDSGQPKDTQGHLARCKEARLPLMADLDANPPHWNEEQRHLAKGTRINRNLEQSGPTPFRRNVDEQRMGEALTRHHGTAGCPRLSHPHRGHVDSALDAGAWEAKSMGPVAEGMFTCARIQGRGVIDAMLAAGAKGRGRAHG